MTRTQAETQTIPESKNKSGLCSPISAKKFKNLRIMLNTDMKIALRNTYYKIRFETTEADHWTF